MMIARGVRGQTCVQSKLAIKEISSNGTLGFINEIED